MSDEKRTGERREEDGMIKQFILSQQQHNEKSERTQEKHNDKIEKALDKIGNVLHRQEAMQIEINNDRKLIDETRNTVATLSKEHSDLANIVRVNSTLVATMDETRKTIQKAVITIIVGALAATVAWMYTSQGQAAADAEYKKAVQRQQSETNKILEKLLTK
tara:strand:+ start:352 stop:837 length:486 start_codon:yes stop_codon:yes gene_type:complete